MAKKIDQSKQLSFWLIEHDILAIRIADENAKITEINLEEARFALNVQKQVFEQQGRKILVISNLTSMSKISKEARDLAKSPEGQKVDDYILAYALVAPNFLARMMGSMIMGLFKQAYPIKIFPNEEKAIEWLLAQRNG